MNEPVQRSKTSPEPETMLRVSDLRQWIYCPRVAFFTLVCPLPKVESWKMQCGLDKEARLSRLQRRRTLRAFGLNSGEIDSNVTLVCPELGLTGRLDLLIRQGPRRFPVEVKFTRGPSRLNHHVQLVGYALLLEDLYGVAVSHGYVVRLPDDRAERIEITPQLRRLTLSLMQTMRTMIQTEQFPPASPLLARCVDCEYRNFCGDVV